MEVMNGNIKVKYIEVDDYSVVIKIEYINYDIIQHLDNSPSSQTFTVTNSDGDNFTIQMYISSLHNHLLDCRLKDGENRRIEFSLIKNTNYIGAHYMIIDKHNQSLGEIITFYNKIFNHLSKLI